MAAEHHAILKNLRFIRDSLEPTSDLYLAQDEAVELFRHTYNWELQNDLPCGKHHDQET